MRKGKRKERVPLPEDLPVEVIELDPEGDLHGMVKIGSVVRRVLTFVPAHFKVLEFHRNRYRDADGKIVTAPLPDEVVGKSRVSTDLMSHV